MLQAETDALKYEAFHSSLNILEREMNLLVSYLTNVGTQASLFAGFCYVCFTVEVEIDELHPGVVALYTVTATTAFGCMMYAVICSTVSVSLGPLMALKGKEFSAFRTAVEHMKADKRNVLRAFAAGTIIFQVLVGMLLWFRLYSVHQFYNGALPTAILLAFFFATARSVRTMSANYDAPNSSAISGQGVVSGNEFLTKAKVARVAGRCAPRNAAPKSSAMVA